jgi:hypothetical protein
MATTVNKVLYLSLLFLMLASSDATAEQGRPVPRTERLTTKGRVKPRKFVRHSKPKRKATKPRVRTTRPPRPTTKKKLRKKLPPNVKYHNLRFLWINEVLGNTRRRTIRKKLNLKKKRQSR